MSTDWKEDAHFVGAFVRGGNWEVGLRIARNVEIAANEGGKPRTSTRISMVSFAREAGVSDKTIRRYLAAWEWAAEAGVVDASADLAPNDEYDFSEFEEGSWKEYFEIACMNPPPWNPQGKPLDSAYGGARAEKAAAKPPTREAVAEAIKADPEVALAARDAIEERDAKADIERARREDQKAPGHREQSNELTAVVIALRKAKRAMHETLGLVIDLPVLDDAAREVVGGNIAEIRKYADAIMQSFQGDSMDAELHRLLSEGV